jgi:integrase
MQRQPSTRTRRRSNDGISLDYMFQMGTVSSKDNRWVARIPYTHPDTGLKLFKTFKGPKARVAADRDEFLKRQELGQVLALGAKPKDKTTGEWCLEWVRETVAFSASRSAHDQYLSVVERLIVSAPEGVEPIGPIPLPKLTQRRVLAWRNDLDRAGVGRASINSALARLKTALTVATTIRELGLGGINPASGVSRLKETKSQPWEGDPSETKLLYELALARAKNSRGKLFPTYMAGLIPAATALGLRRSELVGLQNRDIDWDNGLVHLRRHGINTGDVSKGSRLYRLVPGTKASKGEPEQVRADPQTLAVLRQTRTRLLEWRLAQGTRWRAGQTGRAIYVETPDAVTGTSYTISSDPTAPEAFVFPAPDGDLWEPTTLGNWFVALATEGGLQGKSLHDLRHDCATFLICGDPTRGIPPLPLTAVQKHMRHKNLSETADTYSHLLKRLATLAADTMGRLLEHVFDEPREEAV